MVDGGKVEIDDGVEDEVEELAGVLVVAVAAGAVEGLLGGGAGGVGDGDEEVFAGEDVDGGEDGHLFAGVVGVGLEADRFEDGEGVAGRGVDLDALVFGAGVFDVEGVEVVLLGEFVELGVVGVVELIPGHGCSYSCSCFGGAHGSCVHRTAGNVYDSGNPSKFGKRDLA